MSFFRLIMVIILCSFGGGGRLSAERIYVDIDAAAGGDGSSWGDAFRFLQDGLAAAAVGDTIRIAKGVYCPDRSEQNPEGTMDRHACFQLQEGVTLEGGYQGYDGNGHQKDPNLYVVILCGDLAGNDSEGQRQDLINAPWRSDNCYNVIMVEEGDGAQPAVLEGVVVTGGNANNNTFPRNVGGGLFAHDKTVIVRNCTFRKNAAHKGGGGIYLEQTDASLQGVVLEDNFSGTEGAGLGANECGPIEFVACVVRNNWAQNGGGASFSNVAVGTISRCDFRGNRVELGGGGLFIETSTVGIFDCSLMCNQADFIGGGLLCDDSEVSMRQTFILANEAGYDDGGSGLHVTSKSTLTLTNCTLAENRSAVGGAVTFSALISTIPSTAEITNCILWNEGQEILNSDGSTLAVTYSNVEGGWPGLGNIDADPLFARTGEWIDPQGAPEALWRMGDYHLQSEGWRWDKQRDYWVWDEHTSPCIDTGNPGAPLREERATVPHDPQNMWGRNVRINMGAYGGTDQASFAPPHFPRQADITNDGTVDMLDFDHAADVWLLSGEGVYADFNHDGHVNIRDINILSSTYLYCF